MRRHTDRLDDGFGLVEVILALAILGLVDVVLLPVLITGLQVAGNQSTIASATRLLNETIEQVRLVALDPDIVCEDVEITTTATDGRGIALEAVAEVIANTHAGVAVAPAPPTVVKEDECVDFTAPGSLTVRIAVTRAGETGELADATTIVSIATPEDTP